MNHDWIAHSQWLGTPVIAWVVAGVAALLGYAIAQVAALFLKKQLHKLATRTQRHGLHVATDVVDATHGWLLLLIAIVVALDFLQLGHTAAQVQHVRRALHLLTWALVGMQLAFWTSRLLVAWMNRAADRIGPKSVNPVMLGVLRWVATFLVWATLLLVVLSEAHVNITAFVASLGIGGVAVALALQNILGDMFASVVIGLDKPFEVGDYIGFDTVEGTVTKVGIKSTRLRSLTGEELVISNSVLLKTTLHNYSRRRERRVLFTIRLPFDTPHDKLPAVVERVRSIIAAETPVRFDRGYLTGFGAYGLDFEFVYYVLAPEYAVYTTIQQRINLAMLAAWRELGVALAVPGGAVQVSTTSAPGTLTTPSA